MSVVQKLRDEIAHKEKQIQEIQELCSHPPICVTKQGDSSTGNPMERDEYWYNCHCDLCDKRWTEEQ